MMPVVRDISLNLKPNHILRRQGISDRAARPELAAMTRELLSTMEEQHLVESVVAYETYSVSKISHGQFHLTDGTAIGGTLLPSLLSESRHLAVIVSTIGQQLENKVAEYLEKYEPLRGLLLDGIGSAVIDTLTVETCESIRQEALSRGHQASSPLSPGIAGFALSEQRTLLQIVAAEQIGVRLTASGIMIPRKSTSAVIGIGPYMPTWTRVQICTSCSLKDVCHYKIQT
jgi:hypothetical protein